MLAVSVLMTFLVAWWLTPEMGKLAWRIGAIDEAKDWRRMHRGRMPRSGGIALFAASVLGFFLLDPHNRSAQAAMLGGALVFAIGLADDIWRLRAAVKLPVQVLAALLAVWLYGRAEGLAFWGCVLWVLALTNAHNFIDGLDGLFGGTAVIESVGVFALLLMLGEDSFAMPLAIGAACLGFLYYNRAPAVIFAGDSGSGSIGFLLGVLSLPLLTAPQWRFGFLAPLFLFGYPLTDLITAVLRRTVRLKNPFAADRAHLHHRICATGLEAATCTRVLCLLSASLCLLGVSLGSEELIPAAIGAVGATAFLLTGERRFLVHFAKSS